MNTLVVGLQYGDEGKGRVSAFYGKNAHWFVRFNGGPNAGHTVYKNGKAYKLHHLPAGALTNAKIALDTGMVINYFKLQKELDLVGLTLKDVYISNNVHIIFDKHEQEDSAGSGIGTTKSGIAYVYSDRALRTGKRAEEFFVGALSTRLYKGLPPIENHESVIYESAQGVMLDIDYGAYPYVTSSSVFPSSLHRIDKKVGVMKAYTSRVGDGPPFDREEILELREAGSEYGTTTGRPRRCYWNSLKELDYAIDLYKPNEIVMTKVDILNQIKQEIKLHDGGGYIKFKSIKEYIDFLKNRYKGIKYISNSPDGDLEEL